MPEKHQVWSVLNLFQVSMNDSVQGLGAIATRLVVIDTNKRWSHTRISEPLNSFGGSLMGTPAFTQYRGTVLSM